MEQMMMMMLVMIVVVAVVVVDKCVPTVHHRHHRVGGHSVFEGTLAVVSCVGGHVDTLHAKQILLVLLISFLFIFWSWFC
mgnify:CR=1 FL=1